MPSTLHTSVVPYEVFLGRLQERQQQEAEVPMKSDRQISFERFVGHMVTQCILIAGAVNAARNHTPGEVVPISLAKSYKSQGNVNVNEPEVS